MFLQFLINSIRFSGTFIFGSTGEIITEKSGHLNLGIPGIMCVGACGGCYGASLYIKSLSDPSQAVWFWAVIIPIIFAMLAAGLLGLIYCFLTATLKSNQNVTGLAITTFGVGFTNYFANEIDKTGFSVIGRLFTEPLPFAKHLGVFGELVLSYGVLVYLAIAVALGVAFVINKTRTGLNLKAVGENPATADAAGINVTKYKYVATFIGSAIAGVGGLFYIMDYLVGTWEYAIEGMGWLAIALVIFCIWKANWGILGSIVFGALYIAPNYITHVTFAQKEIIKMLPYLVTIAVLIFISIRDSKESQPPAGLGVNYFREER